MTDSQSPPDAPTHDAREPAERRRRRRRRGGARGDDKERGQPAQAERGQPAQAERGQPAQAERAADQPGASRRRRRRRANDPSRPSEQSRQAEQPGRSRQSGRGRGTGEPVERTAADARPSAPDSERQSKRKRRRRRRGNETDSPDTAQRGRARMDDAGSAADQPADWADDDDQARQLYQRALADSPDDLAASDAPDDGPGDRSGDEPDDVSDDIPVAPVSAEPVGQDDDFAIEPVLSVPEPEPDDPDPTTFDLETREDDDENRALDTRVRNVVGIKFATTGRIQFYDSGDQIYQHGERVIVEGDRPARAGIVAIASARRSIRGVSVERGVRRAQVGDTQEHDQARSQEILAQARELAHELNLPLKVFRAELNQTGKKALIYFSTEERIDFRDLVKRLTRRLDVRVELRQTGVRDEAKLVGGIGACGLELCCSTWLPEFVPVSIKMAKDQGLVLNPTKVSGQCGRLKCCLVYEQETYAAMRKGLPKLGKRVVTEAGEGRVVEVDVLGQRVRVALGPGESRVFPGHEVKPLFPSQAQKSPGPRQK